jgi:hypothetical protein
MTPSYDISQVLVLSEGPNDLTGKVKAHAGHVLVIPIPPVSTTKADKQVKTFSLVSVELSVPIERFLLGYGSRSHIRKPEVLSCDA